MSAPTDREKALAEALGNIERRLTDLDGATFLSAFELRSSIESVVIAARVALTALNAAPTPAAPTDGPSEEERLKKRVAELERECVYLTCCEGVMDSDQLSRAQADFERVTSLAASKETQP